MDALGLIFAYEGDTNMGELSEPRTTSSIPFGGRYRVIDFTLSNMANSNINDIGVIMKEGYQSLLDHIGSGRDWDLSRKLGGISLLPPFGYAQTGSVPRRYDVPFRGKLEALQSIISYIKNSDCKYVVLADAHCVTNIELDKVFDSYIESEADITVVCTKKHVGEPKKSVYYSFGENGCASNITTYPECAGENECLGIYVMKKELLEYIINYGAIRDMCYFEREAIRELMGELKIKPYFHERYAAKMQSTTSYYTHSMELLSHDIRNDLFNSSNPIYTRIRDDAPTYYSDSAEVVGSLVADGCIIEGHVENSILFRGVRVKAGATVKNSIIMANTTVCENAFMNYMITDKNVVVRPGGMLIGSPTYQGVIKKNAEV